MINEKSLSKKTREQLARALSPAKSAKPNKYGAVKTTVAGIRFDSKWESDVYLLLLADVREGRFKDLRRQVSFPHVVNGVTVFRYIADFVVYDTALGRDRIIDAKGVQTPDFRIKAGCIAASTRTPVECWFADGTRKNYDAPKPAKIEGEGKAKAKRTARKSPLETGSAHQGEADAVADGTAPKARKTPATGRSKKG